MSSWNEENFLEEMMRLLQRKKLGSNPCPDPSMLRAVLHGEATEAMTNAVAAHTRQCPACKDLQQRLHAFEAVVVPEEETQWKETEKRLDNWLESFLRSNTAGGHQAAQLQPSRLALWWRDLTSPFVSWRIRWALVPAVTLVLAIGIFLFVKRIPVPQPAQITAEVTHPKEPTANAIPPQNLVEPGGAEKLPVKGPQLLHAPPSAQNKAVASGDIAARAARSAEPRVMPPAATKPVGGNRAVETAQSIMPAPPRDYGQPETFPTPLAVPAGPAEAPAARASVSPNRTVQTAQTHLPPVPARLPRPGTVYRESATPRSVASSFMGFGPSGTLTHAFGAKAASGPASPPPALIRLEAGTRIWILLKSVNPQPDGSFAFLGVALLPVTQVGAVLLDRDTEVSGMGKVSQGKTSVQIMEFVSRGARYRLKGESGAISAQPFGGGGAVEFDAGRVLETFPGSVSTYERVPGEVGPPKN